MGKTIISWNLESPYMADPIPCCLFFCDCKWPNLLPLDMLRQRIQGQGIQPIDYPPVAFVCWKCMNMQIRSLDPDSPYYHKLDKLEWKDQSGDVSFVVLLTTCAENCKFQIPLFVTWNNSTDWKANERWKRDRPKQVDLRCPNGHLIHWNW